MSATGGGLGDRRADAIAARATGLGIGLITFMLVWTVGARITERMLDGPTSAYVAMGIALAVGVLTTVVAGHRLSAAVPHR
ncbi:MAG: hypothetical protein FD127_2754 [Acidimicrobiaceae bacterium]|nr:MAG: hypothetical protein FD127_2754 [Acidimicrobiaceae bacterium]